MFWRVHSMMSASRDLALVRRTQNDHRLDRLAAMRILCRDDARFLDRRMLVHLRFDFRRPHLEAGRIDHSLQSIDEEEVAVLIDIAQIAGAEELLAVEFDEGAPWSLPRCASNPEKPAGRA